MLINSMIFKPRAFIREIKERDINKKPPVSCHATIHVHVFPITESCVIAERRLSLCQAGWGECLTEVNNHLRQFTFIDRRPGCVT